MRRVRRKLLSDDPQRPAILRRLKGLWRHRGRGSLLAFFDVQPITVKAYGGRRYTREKELILAAKQFTARPHPGEQAEMPEWMKAIDTFTPVKAVIPPTAEKEIVSPFTGQLIGTAIAHAAIALRRIALLRFVAPNVVIAITAA